MATVAELLLAKGQQQANARQAQGETYARLGLQLGQIAANVPVQQQQQKIAAQEQQIRDQQVQAGQQQQADRTALDDAYGSGADRATVLARTPGHLRAVVSKQFDDADQAADRVRKAKAEQQEAEHDYFGALASSVKAHGYDVGAASIALAHAKQAGYPEADQIWQAINQDQSQLPQIVDGLIAQSKTYSQRDREAAAQAETARHNLITEGNAHQPLVTVRGPDGRPVRAVDAPGLVPYEKPPQSTEADFLAQFAKEHGVPEDQLTSAQRLAARKAFMQADDRPPVSVQLAGMTPPGDWAKEGDEFLKTVPTQWRKTVEKIAKYDEDPTKVASMRGGMREQLMQWVNQVNPTYDASEFTNRAPTRKAFTTGTQGQQINAINTAIGHIDQLTALADQLGTGSFVPGNKAWNTVRSMFGSDKVTNFDTLKSALAGEVSSVLSKGGATVSGIADAEKHIQGANSPQQLAGYVKTLLPVMGSKLDALDYQYHQAMGANDSFSALSPSSVAILQKHGIDRSHGGANTTTTPPRIYYDASGNPIKKP